MSSVVAKPFLIRLSALFVTVLLAASALNFSLTWQVAELRETQQNLSTAGEQVAAWRTKVSSGTLTRDTFQPQLNQLSEQLPMLQPTLTQLSMVADRWLTGAKPSAFFAQLNSVEEQSRRQSRVINRQLDEQLDTLLLAMLGTALVVLLVGVAMIYSLFRQGSRSPHVFDPSSQKSSANVVGAELNDVAQGDHGQQFTHHMGLVASHAEKCFELVGELVAASRLPGQYSASQNGRTEALIRSLDEVNAPVEALIGTLQQVADGAKTARQSMSTLPDNQSERDVVESTIDELNALADEINQSTDVIQRLEAVNVKVKSLLDVIDELSAQIDLLALNAMIEAARVGEFGQGFAVVSEDVRALIGRTQDWVNDIQITFERLQSITQQAVKTLAEELENAQKSLDSPSEDALAVPSLDQSSSTIIYLNEEMRINALKHVQSTSFLRQQYEYLMDHAYMSSKSFNEFQQESDKMRALLRMLEDSEASDKKETQDET